MSAARALRSALTSTLASALAATATATAGSLVLAAGTVTPAAAFLPDRRPIDHAVFVGTNHNNTSDPREPATRW